MVVVEVRLHRKYDVAVVAVVVVVVEKKNAVVVRKALVKIVRVAMNVAFVVVVVVAELVAMRRARDSIALSRRPAPPVVGESALARRTTFFATPKKSKF